MVSLAWEHRFLLSHGIGVPRRGYHMAVEVRTHSPDPRSGHMQEARLRHYDPSCTETWDEANVVLLPFIINDNRGSMDPRRVPRQRARRKS